VTTILRFNVSYISNHEFLYCFQWWVRFALSLTLTLHSCYIYILNQLWNYNCYYCYLQICGIFISWIAKEISKKSDDKISFNKFKKSRSERNSLLNLWRNRDVTSFIVYRKNWKISNLIFITLFFCSFILKIIYIRAYFRFFSQIILI